MGVSGDFVSSDDGAASRRISADDVLQRIPEKPGAWRSVDLQKSDEEIAVAEADAYLFREYQNEISGERVVVLILAGRSGPISLHPPTACYRARGYREVDPPEMVSTGNGRRDVLQIAEFRNAATILDDRVAIMWGWPADGVWQVPDNPRMEFAGEPLLFKMYVSWDRSGRSDGVTESIPREFLGQILPAVSAAMRESQSHAVPDRTSHTRSIDGFDQSG